MLNEVLYMEIRLLQQFRSKFKISASMANMLFNNYSVWKYIEDCYDSLHTSGDEYILSDIEQILKAKGVSVQC